MGAISTLLRSVCSYNREAECQFAKEESMASLRQLEEVYTVSVTGCNTILFNSISFFNLCTPLNAEQNYWGSPDINVIRQKLFDFDDWNSYAITHFLPYYIENR